MSKCEACEYEACCILPCEKEPARVAILEQNADLLALLRAALPHIECRTKDQDNLITAIGEALTKTVVPA